MPDGTPYRSRADAVADRKLRQREELEQIRQGLREQAADLAQRLTGMKGVLAGDDLRFGATGKLRVTVRGNRMRGRWHDYGSDEHGDMLGLIRRHQGLNFVGALDYARSYLGMPQPDYARPLSSEDRAAIAARLEAMERARLAAEAEEQRRIEAGYARVARRAQRLWDVHADRPAPADHPYITKKAIDPAGLRVTRKGTLLVPVRGADGTLQTLQRIWPDGDKRGLSGGRMRGGRLVLGEVDPDKAVLFCEGVATGKSLHRSTGLPVVVCFSAGNLREVMRDWRASNPEPLLICAGDNDHHKPRMTPPQKNVGALMAERMREEIGAVPVLPPFAESDPGKDWNDYEQSAGAAAVRQQITSVIKAAAAAKEKNMDGATSAAPAPEAKEAHPAPGASSPAPAGGAAVDPRRVLIEATALEGLVTLNMDMRAAVAAAQGFVRGLQDDEVRKILDTAGTRGWIMQSDGSLDAKATTAALKTQSGQQAKAAAEPAARATGKAAPGASASASGGPAASPAPNPLQAAVGQMAAQVDALREREPNLAKTIASLAEKASTPDAFRHEGLRTRLAWAIMDFERTTGTKVDLPPELRRELEGRMVTYPGLTNPRAQSLLRQTATMASLDLVREVRRVVANIAKAGDQDTPDIADQLSTLNTRIRVQGGGAPTPEAPAEPRPAQAAPASREAAEAPPTAPAPPRKAEGSTVAASPGPGQQVDARASVTGKQDAGAVGGAAQPQQPQEQGAAAGAGRKTLASYLLNRAKPAPSDGHPPWERITSGLADRLEKMELGIADRRTARIVSEAESAGQAAMSAVERFAAGPGRSLLDKIQTAAARDPAGLEGVMSEMKHGGKHAALRTEFDEAMRLNPGFAKGYDATVKAIGRYGEARQAQIQEFERRGIDPAKGEAFERIDASLGEDAARIPGREEGKSALRELAAKTAELFQKAMDAVRSAFRGATAAVTSSASASPSPSPSP